MLAIEMSSHSSRCAAKFCTVQVCAANLGKIIEGYAQHSVRKYLRWRLGLLCRTTVGIMLVSETCVSIVAIFYVACQYISYHYNKKHASSQIIIYKLSILLKYTFCIVQGWLHVWLQLLTELAWKLLNLKLQKNWHGYSFW